jgi:hypothetical protein
LSGEFAMAKFFIRFRDKIKGPFSGPDLQVFAEKGQLKPAMHISSDGKKWVEARTLDSLWPEIEIEEEPIKNEAQLRASLDETAQLATASLPSMTKTDGLPDLSSPQNELLAELGLDSEEETGEIEIDVEAQDSSPGNAAVKARLESLEEQVEILRRELAEANRVIQSHSMVLNFINKQNAPAAPTPPPSSVVAPPPRKSSRVSRRRRRI